MFRFGRKAGVIAVAGLAVVALTAGCSSSSSKNSGGGGGGTTPAASSAGVKEAQTLVTQYQQVPTNIGVTEKITKPIPTGKTLAVMVCGQPACDIVYDYMSEAAKNLGWTAKKYIAGPTPDKNKAAWDLVVRQQPDAVFSSGFPRSLWDQQAKKLEAKGIPIVECCTTDTPGDGVIYNDLDEASGKLAGKEQADWVIANSNGKAKTAYVNIPAYPIIAAQAAGFKDELKRLCPSCGYDTIDLNIADIGSPAATQTVVGYMQSHKDVNYLGVGDDDSFAGIPAALKSAGFKNLKAVGLSPNETSIASIASGGIEQAAVAYPQQELAWKAVDILARHFTGMPLTADAALIPRRIFDKANITDSKTVPVSTPSFKTDFLALWGKS